MSRYHTSNTNEVTHMIADAKKMSQPEMMRVYNAEVWEDGQVYDLTQDQVYLTISEWANAIVDQDGNEYDDLYEDDKYSDIGDFH